MEDSFGEEKLEGEHRYRLSFTVGGLLAVQGRVLAGMYLEHLSVHSAADFSDSANQPDSGKEIGKDITCIRERAVEENVLAIRTVTAGKRIVAETTKRLSALTLEELAYLGSSDVSMSDREALMWIAMCRYYAIVGEFANEVLRKRYLVGNPHLDFEDYARFIANKATWHPELEIISEGTAKKLRSNVFKAMVEAHLLDKVNDSVLRFLPSPSLTDILMKRQGSFGYLPMRESSL